MSTTQEPTQSLNWSNFKSPGSDDCLNVLANYGFLPHSGKSISKDQFIQALMSVYNIDHGIAETLALGALIGLKGSADATIDLHELGKHDVIEHDASLSRKDIAFGDNVVFSKEKWDKTVAKYHEGFTGTSGSDAPADGTKGEEMLTNWALAGKVRFANVAESRAEHEQAGKTFGYGIKQAITSYGETTLYLSVLGKDGRAKLDWIEMFFEQERLPIEQGWQRPSDQITQGTFNHAFMEMIKGGDYAVQEAEWVGTGTVKLLVNDLLSGLHLMKSAKTDSTA